MVIYLQQLSWCYVKVSIPNSLYSTHYQLQPMVSCAGTNNMHDVTVIPAGSYFTDLFRAYSEDMCAKESMVNDIMKQNDRDILTVYLLCWLHQPYINNQCRDKLEVLLVDSGLRA